MKTKLYIALSVTLTVALILLISCRRKEEELVASGVTNFDMLHLAAPTDVATATPALMVDSSGASNPFEIRIASTPQVYVDSSGSTQLGPLTYFGFADLTVTDGTTPTISSMVYALDSASAVTITLAACANDGQPLILIGDDANTITINDSNIRSHDGAALTLGQYDVIFMICQDTEWLQVVELASE